MELVVQRPDPSRHRHILRHAGQVAAVLGRAVEKGGEVRGEHRVVRDAALAVRAAAENDHEPSRAQRADDLGEVVLVGDAAERRLEPRLLPQDRGLQTLERRPGLDAELLDERLTGVLVRRERLHLTARAVEREHQLAAKPLPERMPRDERLELADDLLVAAGGEIRLDPRLE